MVRILCFHCRGHKFNPWSGNSSNLCVMAKKKKRMMIINKHLKKKKKNAQDFLGGTVVKNLPANAGDTGSSPGPGRSHMPQSN